MGALPLMTTPSLAQAIPSTDFSLRVRQACCRPRHCAGEAYASAMNGSVDTIVAEAVQLPPDQRLTLAHKILSSIEPERSTEIDAAWDHEIRDRIARYDAGGVQCIPATEVFAELDRRLRP